MQLVKQHVSILYRARYFLFLWVLCLGIHASSFAQTRDKLRFERYTIEHGLSSDRIQDITQDNLGYIWVATQSGVSRYDGYDFKVYRNIPGDASTLSDNIVRVIFAGSDRKLWVGTNYGLNVYNPVGDSFRRLYHIPGDDTSLPGNIIHELFESKSGDLWLGTNNGLAMYDSTSDAFISHWYRNGERVNLLGVEVLSITEGANGILWIGTGNRGLISFNPRTNAIRYLDQDPIPGVNMASSIVSKVFADADGTIWIGFLPESMSDASPIRTVTTGGLGRLNPETNAYTLFKFDPITQPEFWNRVSDIIEAKDGTIWVTTFLNATYSGLHRFDRKTEKFHKYAHDPLDPTSLIWSYATAVYEDRFSNLWVATSRGLNKADMGKWQMPVFNFRPGYPDILIDNYYGIEEVDDGIFWLGLDGVGFVEWNRKTGESSHYGEITPYPVVSDMEVFLSNLPVYKRDPNGEVWIGSFETGLSRFNLQTKQIVRHISNEADPLTISGNNVTGLLIDRSNTLWISTTNGLNRYNREDGTFTSWTTKNSSISSNSLSTIFQDSQGIIWLGTSEYRYQQNGTSPGGLIRFEPTGETFTTFVHDPNNPFSIGNNTVASIVEDQLGFLWIGTNNGLNRFDTQNERFERFLVSDGLPDPIILGLLIDDDGKLWISTMKGLSRFDPITKTFRNFDTSDGVQGNRFNDFSYFKTKDGELMFGGVSGLNFFRPSEIVENAQAPLVFLTGIQVNNSPFALSQPVYEIGNIELDWDDNSLGFEFTAINFRLSELTVYEYKLEGYDSGWISSGTRRFANYTNLPPNDYVFKVRAVNADGVLSDEMASLSIRINPPFWRTWWAYGFYLVMFAGMVFGVDRTQRRRLIQKERERTRELELAQAKEIEQAYNNLEAAHENLKSAQTQLIQQEKLASLGQLTAGIAHEIKNPLNFVNNFSNVSLEMIDEVLDEVEKKR
jgi:ligand-binding sensor domain-containing protein